MHIIRQWCLLSALAAVLTGTSMAQPVAANIDAARVGQPITKLIFGGFMEPATTQVWAEMLSDRKFFNEINSKPAAAPAGGFGRRGPQRRWMPVGADEFVAMDCKNVYVGEWTPLIRLEAVASHGISQSGFRCAQARPTQGVWCWQVAVTGNSPQHVIQGTLAVDLPAHPSGSSTYPVDVFAALSADRRKLSISAVNPTETTQACDLNLSGVQPNGAARVWQLTAPAGTVAPPAGPGRPGFIGPPATMLESSLPQAPRRITLPPSSVTVYEFEVR